MSPQSESALNESKAKLRKKILDLRALIGNDMSEMASQSTWALLQKNADFKKSGVVAAFASIRGEIDTYPILEGVLAAGKKLALPHVSKDKTQLRFYEVKDLNGLTPGEFGILCPEPVHAVAMDKIDLILVPGLAFDRKGYRLGFGKGYYDRALPNLRPSALSVGLCYSFQLVDSVPAGTHDIPVKALLHEKDLEYCQD
jgi:5-formyltetrahydrofolate cyclo-ligase